MRRNIRIRGSSFLSIVATPLLAGRRKHEDLEIRSQAAMYSKPLGDHYMPLRDPRHMTRVNHFSNFLVCVSFLAILALASGTAQAGFLSHNYKGDFGLMAGTQPPPGLFTALAYVNYQSDTARDKDGNKIILESLGNVDVKANGYAAGFWYVTEYKIFGGNYSFMVFPALTDNNLEAPVVSFEQQTATGLADTYFQPINLGWHTDRADYMAGLGVFAPTGSYDPDATDNLGLGMWSLELFAGTTQYFGADKSWNFAVIAAYETHSKKEDTDIRVGDILTVEGGFGKSFIDGAVNVGVAFEGQWKITADEAGEELQPVFDALGIEKHRVYGLGPEITLPIATKKKLYGFINVRYMQEFDARSTIEGDSFSLIASFPIPPVSLD